MPGKPLETFWVASLHQNLRRCIRVSLRTQAKLTEVLSHESPESCGGLRKTLAELAVRILTS